MDASDAEPSVVGVVCQAHHRSVCDRGDAGASSQCAGPPLIYSRKNETTSVNLRVLLSVFLVSATVMCFEIVATRVSSVIFACDYAFIILSLAILGIGVGGIVTHYQSRNQNDSRVPGTTATILDLLGISLLLFLFAVTELQITIPVVYFVLLLLPFVFAGIFSSRMFKRFAERSFSLYAADLSGAALGAIAPMALLEQLGASNCILFVAAIAFGSALLLNRRGKGNTGWIRSSVLLAFSAVFLVLNVILPVLGNIPIGEFAEKDYYSVYPDAARTSHILDSRWSIYGRADLVQYDHQDHVRQLFIDGAAGSPLFRFNGEARNPGSMLYNLLLSQTTAIPFLFLGDDQKNSMLVIGPGGGKEVLLGLFSGVKQITGVEVNPDFVQIVKRQRQFDGGIYDNFPNVEIAVQEGRTFVRQTTRTYDLIVMALPSTQQIQNVDNLAMSENYLLTVEALKDYLNILTPSGELVFTVHNRLELQRLLMTTTAAFNELGMSSVQALERILLVEQDYAPTIVIRKNDFTADEIQHIRKMVKLIPAIFPNVTYAPWDAETSGPTGQNRSLEALRTGRASANELVRQSAFDVTPCRDDSPFFYKLRKGIEPGHAWLLGCVSVAGLAATLIPLFRVRRARPGMRGLTLPLMLFMSIGIGFMIIEVAMFQKMVLYLGAPTISLSILLSSLLIGMGLGSISGGRIFPGDIHRRLLVACSGIVLGGVVLFLTYPILLNPLMKYGVSLRAVVSFLMLFPFGFLLGIPFPTGIQLLKRDNMERYVPWMYGINGIMAVLGSVVATVISMMSGFTPAFLTGLAFYAFVAALAAYDGRTLQTGSGERQLPVGAGILH